MRGAPHAGAAVILGSGLTLDDSRLAVRERIGYHELGWPVTEVPGHPSMLTLADVRSGGSPADETRAPVLIAAGRPHRYEGWSDEELERPARDLVAAGAGRLLLACACGALRPDLRRGDLCMATELVDLQRSPGTEPERQPLCPPAAAQRAAAAGRKAAQLMKPRSPDAAGAVSPRVLAIGAYAAVTGPHYETPAEAGWLAGMADVVGMSAAPEVRAARSLGAQVRLLAVVTNVSGASLGHGEVLHAGAQLGGVLTAVVAALLLDEESWR